MIIYKIINKLDNNKVYIGKHSKSDSNEELQKGRYWGSGKYIKRAIKKYGKENFEREVLIQGIQTKKELDLWEKILIWGFGSKRPTGYNLTDGGDGGDTFTDNPDKEKTRQKWSERRKGVKRLPFSVEWKRKISESREFFLSTPEGNKWRKEQIERIKNFYQTLEGKDRRKEISESRMGKKNPEHSKRMSGANSPRAREVVLISPDGVPHQMKSYLQFCKNHNLSAGKICEVLKGRQNNHKGWTGKYL